ncbi:MAG: hypothetical protein LH609_14325 [Rudanella sp.]|nr:hypothetical protein [Rudanella sp.]
MTEEEFNDNIQRELARIKVQLRLHEERLAENDVRMTRLENRLSRQEQQLALIEARHDRLVHQHELIMRYVGLTPDDIQQIQIGNLNPRYLMNTVGRRMN